MRDLSSFRVYEVVPWTHDLLDTLFTYDMTSRPLLSLHSLGSYLIALPWIPLTT